MVDAIKGFVSIKENGKRRSGDSPSGRAAIHRCEQSTEVNRSGLFLPEASLVLGNKLAIFYILGESGHYQRFHDFPDDRKERNRSIGAWVSYVFVFFGNI